MKVQSGNLLDVHSGVIAHQVNCQGAFGAGVAGQIAKKYPIVKDAYMTFCHKAKSPNELYGQCLPVHVSKNLIVVNMFSQFYYGNAAACGATFTNPPLLFNCIAKTRAHYPGLTIYLPWKVGCGLAGGNWDEILPQLENIYAHDDQLIIIRRPGD